MADGNDDGAKTNSNMEDLNTEASFLGEEEVNQGVVECNICPETFSNHHALIKHLLKSHCSYTGLICPYCRDSHHPQRFIDLQAHVMNAHMDKLTGYGVSNECKLCKKSFTGYAELRDHVQIHGDMFREPAPNKELYKENARRKRQERRIDRQKQRQLATKQNIFEAAKTILENVNDSKLTILRKVTNEELLANNIKRLSTGQIVIEDQSLLAKSIVHHDMNNVTNKQLMVPIHLNKDTAANIRNGSNVIDIQEDSSPPQTTERIDFEEEQAQNDFGSIKLNGDLDCKTIQSSKTLDDHMKSSDKITNDTLNQRLFIKQFVSIANPYLDSNILSNIIPECPPPSPNTPAEETRKKSESNNVPSKLNSDISDDDEGQTGIVVVNTDFQLKNDSFKASIVNGENNSHNSMKEIKKSQRILSLPQPLAANILRIMKILRITNQNKNVTISANGHRIESKGVYGIPQGLCEGSTDRQRKKDLVLASNPSTEVFRKLKEGKENEKCHPKFDISLENEIDANVNTSAVSFTAAEKFQEISSPYSVAALLAAAELEEELSSHDDE